MLFHVAFILIGQTFLTIIAWLSLTTNTPQYTFRYILNVAIDCIHI